MKKRQRRYDLEKQAYWEAVVRRWEQGGQSVRAYCRAEGLRESAFYWWRRELKRPSQAARPSCERQGASSRVTSAPRPLRRVVSQRHSPVSFLPVHVVQDGMTVTGGVEIVLSHGRAIRVQPGFNRQTLFEVLSALESLPC